jgi:phosphoglycerate dehydrogenase-like enzyme
LKELTALLPWLDAADLPGGLPLELVTSYYDGGPEPEPRVLSEVVFYVLPYMGAPADVELINRMPELQVVQTLTAGVDNVRGRIPDGVTLCNAAGVHDASTAELAVGLMLSRLRGIDDAARDTVTGQWQHRTRTALADSHVMIVGFGGVGQAIARRLKGFEVDVIPVVSRARDGVHGVSELPELLPQADVVVLAVPLTADSEGLVDAGFLASMKPGALLINVARGRIVDTTALLAALIAGRITAALDVTDPEPLPPDHPLWSAPGILITPHVGGNTTAFEPRARRLVAEQLRRFATGEDLLNVIA